MNKFYSVVALALVSICAISLNAKQLSPGEAQARISQKNSFSHSRLASSGNMQLVYTQVINGSSDNAAYVFTDKNANGFIIASADDCAPAVLGYSEVEQFDPNNIPSNMLDWLETYAEQIAAAKETGSRVIDAYTDAARTAISPLCATKWNQGDPYNRYCPQYTSGTTKATAVTGCVATAMAQLLKQLPWHPTKGTGSKTYQAKAEGGYNGELTANFGATTYDWDNMTNTYNSKSTTEQINAVATLMFHCGVSVEMSYASSSGAVTSKVPSALVQYFGYDKSTHFLERDYFSINEWIGMVYDELTTGRAVLYSGRNSSAGHCFIVDGFDPSRGGNYFHLNWGWGGMSDGYFLLTGLDPSSQGYGGSSAGYNISQGALFGAVKECGGKYHHSVNVAGAIATPSPNYTKTSTSAINFTFGNAEYPVVPSSSAGSFSATMGWEVVNEATKESVFVSTQNRSFTVGNMYGSPFGVSPNKLSSGLAQGDYRIYPSFKVSGDDAVHHCGVPSTSAPYLLMNVGSTSINFSQESTASVLEVVESDLLSPLYAGRIYHYTAEISNTGFDFAGNVHLRFKKGRLDLSSYVSDEVTIVVPKAGTAKIDAYFTLPSSMSAGDYTMVLLNQEDIEIAGSSTTVTVNANPETNTFKYSPAVENASAMPTNRFNYTGTVNVTAGYFDTPIIVAIFNASTGENVQQYNEQLVLCEQGKSAALSIEDDLSGVLVPGTRYVSQAFDANTLSFISNSTIYFTAAEPINTGIEAISKVDNSVNLFPTSVDSHFVVAAGGEISHVSVMAISGVIVADETPATNSVTIDASNFAAGLYIVKVTTADGIAVKRIVKK